MGPKRRILVYLIAAAIVVVIVLYPSTLPTDMPTYKGRPIEGWLYDYVNATNPPELRAYAGSVLREMGTNWTPVLIERLSDVNDSKIKEKAVEILNKQPWVKFSRRTARERRQTALNELIFWGPGVAVAVPELANLSRNTNEEVALTALSALAIASRYADAPIVEPFAAAAASTNRFIRLNGLGLMAEACFGWQGRPDILMVGSYPEEKILAVMLDGAKDADAAVQDYTIGKLGELKLRPEIVIPLLTNFLANSNSGIRFTAAEALGRYGLAAQPAMPALTNAMRDPDRSVSGEAATALREIQRANWGPMPVPRTGTK